MAVAGKSIKKVQGFKTALSHEFEISDLGDLKYILGIQIMRNHEVRTISMNQTAYIHQILARFGMSKCMPVSTPLAVKHNLSTSQSPKTEEEVTKYLEYSNGLHYLEIVGALLYATQTHPDIQYAISIVLQFGGNSGKPHLKAAKCILRYLKDTADNQDCIALACNPVTHTHAKHIDIHECIENKEVNLQYCSIKDTIADIFIKQLPQEAFECFRSALGINKI